MYFQVNPSAAVPLYQQIKDQVKRMVASGLLRQNDKVPSVRELAVQLHINPMTVAKAFHELEHEGVLTTLQGKGTFVKGESSLRSLGERKQKLQFLAETMVVETYQLGLQKSHAHECLDRAFQNFQNDKNKGRC